jgi:hypothetical protein
VHLVGFLFIVVIADARNHEPEMLVAFDHTHFAFNTKLLFQQNNAQDCD